MTGSALELTAEEVRKLLRSEEGQFLEFKSLWQRDEDSKRVLDRRTVRDWVAEVAAAFANADGGTLVLGVDDDGTPSGHGYPEEAILEFFATPERRLRPSLRCRGQRVELDGHQLLLIEVPMCPEAVMVEGNGFPYRVGDQVRREPQEVINARKEAYRRVGYEQRFAPEASLQDLDLELVKRFFAESPLGDRSPEELLQHFGLVEPRAGGYGIRNAALLLFARELSRWHPRAGLRFFRVHGTERRHGGQRNVVQGAHVELPLARAIAEAHRLASQQIGRSEKLHDLFFKETPEYPTFAWQEAIVNAYAHRDYEVQGQEIEVWFYADRMEVRSPGALIPPVTLEALRAGEPVHASRNPRLVRVLAQTGFMREEGEGVPRIFEEMRESFLAAPLLEFANGVFSVTLKNEPIFSNQSAEWRQLVEGLKLSVAQRRVLLAHPDGFTNGEFQKLNDVDRDEAYREIQELVQLGVVESAEKPGRGAIYRISPELLRRREFLSRRLSALRRYFAAHARLKNADYRALFELTREASRRELRQLVDQGFLRMEGERKGAEYRPLPSLGAPEI
ncbi:MAG: putative DNA binding domain-containing protein [Planctomycetes bacterium]|nr:putative DNA binding domain-containing protein [Planctomycetota bacterium]